MKKRIGLTAIVLSAVLALSGCAAAQAAAREKEAAQEAEVTAAPTEIAQVEVEEKTEEPEPTAEPTATPEPEPQEEIPEGYVKSILTGEYVEEEIGKRRPFAIMIDNVKDALPQSGISKADVMYESVVEGSYTRMCAVFQDYSDLGRIGPIRSCRDYFISLVAGFDPIYTHYGQAAYALAYLESDNVDNVSGLADYAYSYFFRDNTYNSAPHNAYIDTKGVDGVIEHLGYRRDLKEDYESQLSFVWVGEESEIREDAVPATYVAPGYLSNAPWFEYHEDDQLYYRFEYGAPHMDVDADKQLAFTNIILEYQNYDHYQKTGYLHFNTVDNGKAVYITRGKAQIIHWYRPSFYEPVEYYYEDTGEEIKLNTGRTMICVIQNEFAPNCKLGTSRDDAKTVFSEEDTAALVQHNLDWKGWYEYQEDPWLSEMDKERVAWIESHGGKSKVESTWNIR